MPVAPGIPTCGWRLLARLRLMVRRWLTGRRRYRRLAAACDPLWRPHQDEREIARLDQHAAALRRASASAGGTARGRRLIVAAEAADVAAERLRALRWRDLALYLALRHHDPRQVVRWPDGIQRGAC